MGARPLIVALVALSLGSGGLHAQVVRPRSPFAADSSVRTLPAPLAGLLSAAVPGAGEYALHLDRWVPQIAFEALAWWQYGAHRREGRVFERRYRALACQAARGQPPGACRDTSYFEYYEQMGKPRWNASGPFDADLSAPGIQPDTSTGQFETYNGHVWALGMALEGFNREAALAYYQANAIPASYSWDWGDSPLEQTVYSEYIRRSDDAFRTSSRILGFILVNHLTSAVDAFIVARLRELRNQPGIQVRSGLEPAGGGLRWRAGVSLPAPR